MVQSAQGNGMKVDVYGFLADEVMFPALVRSYWGLKGYRTRLMPLLSKLLNLTSAKDKEFVLSLNRDQVLTYIGDHWSGPEMTAQRWLDNLQKAGVGAVVLHCQLNGNPEEEPDQQEKHLGHLASIHMGKIIPFGSILPTDDDRAKIYIERAVLRRNFKGISIRPFRCMRNASDPIWFPIYEVCQQLHIPVWIDCSAHHWSDVPMDIHHPMHVDRVAAEFPRLNIIMGQTGWPWVQEAMFITLRHANVYVDVSSWLPSEISRIGSGFEGLFHYGGRLVCHKVVFGSQWHWNAVEPEAILEQYEKLPITDQVREKWLGANAAKLLDITYG